MSYDVIRNSIVPIDDFDIFQDGEIVPPTKQCWSETSGGSTWDSRTEYHHLVAPLVPKVWAIASGHGFLGSREKWVFGWLETSHFARFSAIKWMAAVKKAIEATFWYIFGWVEQGLNGVKWLPILVGIQTIRLSSCHPRESWRSRVRRRHRKFTIFWSLG